MTSSRFILLNIVIYLRQSHNRYEVWTICSNTLLGSVSTVAGQSITLEMLRKKPAMIEAMRMREPHEAPLLDTGEVPGDHLGAAGFDSAFFAHLKVFQKLDSLVGEIV